MCKTADRLMKNTCTEIRLKFWSIVLRSSNIVVFVLFISAISHQLNRLVGMSTTVSDGLVG